MSEPKKEDKEFEYTSGVDVADSIGLIVLCALVFLVFLVG